MLPQSKSHQLGVQIESNNIHFKKFLRSALLEIALN